MYYFFRSVIEKGRNRLRPLSNQSFADGTAINVTFNVQSDKKIRADYPIGTIFGSNHLEPSGIFYTAGILYPLGLNDEDLVEASHKPPVEMVDAYNTFIGGGTGVEVDLGKVADELEAEPAPAPIKRTYLDRLKDNGNFRCPKEKDGFYVNQSKWYLLLRNVMNGVNTMLIGPTGTGKTELVMLICKTLGIECCVYDMGSMYDPVAGLLGVHRLQKGGESVFDYAKFTQDIQKPCVVLLDELSRAPVTTNNILFPCLDSRRNLPVEIACGDSDRTIRVNKKCCFIATANVGAEYTGTMSMDRALVNRFFPVELDYMPVGSEIKILSKRTGVSTESAKKVVSVANSIRNLYKKQELSVSVSTREALMVAELISDGWDDVEALQLVFLPLFEGTDVDGERGIVNKIFMGK